MRNNAQTNIFIRLSVWSSRPFTYKVKTIKVRLHRIIASLAVPALKVLHGKILNRSRYYRQAVFQSVEPNTLLISKCESEIFIVSSSDKVIARDVYIEKSPFDFEKFLLVVSLLGPNHKRTTLIDIGANIGTICIPAITRGIFKKAIAIEPEPHNYKILTANVVINDLCEKVELHNIALGGVNESVVFELSDLNYGDHRVQADNAGYEIFNESARKKITVKSTTLNHLIAEINPADTLIWMDVQGFEGYVLSGASDVMRKQTPICLEFWPYGLKRSGCYSQLKSALVNNGYKQFYNLHDNIVSPKSMPLTEEAIDNLYNMIGESGGNVDLLVL